VCDRSRRGPPGSPPERRPRCWPPSLAAGRPVPQIALALGHEPGFLLEDLADEVGGADAAGPATAPWADRPG